MPSPKNAPAASHGDPPVLVPTPVALSPAQSRAARRIIAAKLAGNVADILANAKTTIPWMMQAAGAPAVLIGLAVPIRESGSMLPQLWLARFVRGVSRRKRVSAVGALGQALACIAMGLAGWTLRGWAAGSAVLAALALLATMRALSSIASKDVLGRAIPKGARGRVTGQATSLAGALGALGSLAAIFMGRGEASPWAYAAIVGGAAIAFVACALGYALVDEPAPKVTADHTVPAATLARIWGDPVLKRFVLTRTLLLGSALGAPYLVLFGRQDDAALSTLGAFVLAGGAAAAVSARAWGRLADAKGHHAMAYGGALAAAAGAVAVALRLAFPPGTMPIAVWAGLYFVFSAGYAGVRVGRKTYVVDIATGDLRTAYVASSNTVIAIALLAFGGIGAGLHAASGSLALLFFVICTAVGAGMATQLGLADPAPT